MQSALRRSWTNGGFQANVRRLIGAEFHGEAQLPYGGDSRRSTRRRPSRRVIITNTKGLGKMDLSELILPVGGLSNLSEETTQLGTRELKYFIATFVDVQSATRAIEAIQRRTYRGVQIGIAFHREIGGLAMEWDRLKESGWKEFVVKSEDLGSDTAREIADLEDLNEALDMSSVFNHAADAYQNETPNTKP